MKALAVTPLLLAPAVAFAAPKPDFDAKDTRAIAYDYAGCTVKRRHAQAREVILANLDNSAILKRYPALARGECLVDATQKKTSSGVEMRFPGDTIRYGLADALFATDLAAVAPRDLSAAAPLTHARVDESEYEPEPGKKISKRRAEEMEKARSIAVGSAAISRFGECVVRRDSRNSHKLLAAKPTTSEESRAFADLQPAFEACLAAGRTFKTNRTMMRETIAINYYRLAFAPLAPKADVARR